MIFSSIYRPPSCSPNPFCQELELSIRKALARSRKLMLLGDFNAKNASWMNTDKTNAAGESIEYLFHRYQLNQLVDFPTHLHQNTPSSCLDLIATTFCRSLTRVTSLAPVGGSDHFSLHCEVSSQSPCADVSPTKQANQPQWSWTSDRVRSFKDTLVNNLGPFNEQWASSHSVDDLWQEWRCALLTTARQCCLSKPLSSKARKRRAFFLLALGLHLTSSVRSR